MIVKIDLTNDNSYEIYIEKLKALSFDRKVVVVTNPTVAGFHLEYLKSKLTAKELSICTIKDGEEYKNMQTLEDILSSCFEAKLDRKSLLVAFGGGVIGDMTGFAASIYQRGIDFIQIPTTLLSQVDASVGGKTGINNKYGKNLVGTFYQPDGVLIDPETLNTLPIRHLREGLAEAIKYGAIADVNLFEKIESLADEADFLTQPIPIIYRCCEIKKEIVEQDERDMGLRFLLNFGHTIGHGIEQVAGYGKYNHGEAVAIGMNQITRITEKRGSTQLGTAKRLEKLIKKFNLPLTYASVSLNEISNAMTRDKKGQGSSLKMVQLKEIGQADLFSIDKSELLDFLLSTPQEGVL